MESVTKIGRCTWSSADPQKKMLAPNPDIFGQMSEYFPDVWVAIKPGIFDEMLG